MTLDRNRDDGHGAMIWCCCGLVASLYQHLGFPFFLSAHFYCSKVALYDFWCLRCGKYEGQRHQCSLILNTTLKRSRPPVKKTKRLISAVPALKKRGEKKRENRRRCTGAIKLKWRKRQQAVLGAMHWKNSLQFRSQWSRTHTHSWSWLRPVYVYLSKSETSKIN